MKGFLTAIIVAALLTAPLSVSAISVSAESAVVMDMASGRVLYSKNADVRRPIASTTKIMTASIALQSADLDDIVVIDESSANIEGSSLYLKAGDKVTVGDLLAGVMLRSGNDAAHALALHCAGSIEAFAGQMNAKAKQLGMINSSFANPHGLDSEYHYSTAYDMAILTCDAMRNPDFAELVKKKSAQAAGQVINNHNKLLSMYDGAVGVKTGFTKTAGRCLVSAAERNGQTLVAVTLKAPDDWDDHMLMLDYGFTEYPLVTLKTGGTVVGEVPVIGGEKPHVSVKLGDNVTVALREEELSHITTSINVPRQVWATVRENTYAGVIRYYLNGYEIAHGDLFWNETVEIQKDERFWGKIIGKITKNLGGAGAVLPKGS